MYKALGYLNHETINSLCSSSQIVFFGTQFYVMLIGVTGEKFFMIE